MNNDLLNKKSLVEDFLRSHKEQYRLSTFSFVNVFAWQPFFDFEFRNIDGNLCVFARNELGAFLYLPPLGEKISAGAVAECFADMETVNKGSGVSRIENVSEDLLASFSGGRYSFFRKGYEYLYYRKDIVELKGNAFKPERAAYNHFVKHYRYQYLPFVKSMKAECLALYDRWAAGRRKKYDQDIYLEMIKDSREVHRLALEFSRELELSGRVVLVDGEIRAYSFGYPLNRRCFCVFLEIADLAVKGLPVFIFREFCAEEGAAQFINVMDDSGIENIRRTKLSFHPCCLEPSYVVTAKGA